jgi:hypothetical protein
MLPLAQQQGCVGGARYPVAGYPPPLHLTLIVPTHDTDVVGPVNLAPVIFALLC